MAFRSLRRRLPGRRRTPASSGSGGPVPPHHGPVCRVTVDLRQLPAGGDPATAERLLRDAPGVLEVRLRRARNRAVVVHDSRTSLPELWNWLCSRFGPRSEA